MTVDIVIPSLNRIEKLDRCLNSLFLADGLDHTTIWLYLSDPVEYQHYWAYFEFAKGKVNVIYTPEYKVPEFWNSHLAKMTSDALFTCNDDCEFHKDTIINILNEFEKAYPDYDGVMGIRQSNAIDDQGFEGAFTVIGSKYADRFPDRKVWCPDYYRLHADAEMTNYAKSINKFCYSPKCQIIHWHPAFGGQIDSTHIKVREYRDYDKKIYRLRQGRKLLWGQTFQLLGDSCVKLV